MDLTYALAQIDMDGDMGDAGLPGEGITEGEKLTVNSRLLDLEGRGLADLADTSGLGSPPDGKVPVSNDGEWELVDLPGSAVWGSVSGTLADQTDLQAALDGKADTGHTHNEVLKGAPSTSNLSNASSGTTTLVTTTITLLNGITYDIDATGICEGYGNSGTIGIGKLRVTINGNSSTTPVDFSWEQGVDAPKTWAHTLSVTGTGAAITISFAFVWTSGVLKPWCNQLVYRAEPRR